MELPREYNAAVDLIERNLSAGRGAKVAYIDDSGSTTYAQLAERVDRAANALRGLGRSPRASPGRRPRGAASASRASGASRSRCTTRSTGWRCSSARSRPASCP
jgi:hypothetical protein